MFRIRIITGVVAGALFIAISGVGNCSQLSEEDRRFFRISHREQERQIILYPMEKQLDLYVHGMTKIRPLSYHLLEPVAGNGKAILPLAIERLRSVKDENELSAVLALLLQIDQDVYHWRTEPEFVGMTKKTAMLLENPAWQQRILHILE
jgi:hypothetical protein